MIEKVLKGRSKNRKRGGVMKSLRAKYYFISSRAEFNYISHPMARR